VLVYNNIKPNMLPKSSCALGMFDGVHLGHQAVISSARKKAKVYNCPTVTVTFSTHPQYITSNTPTPQLTLLEDRLNLFEKIGVDIAIVLDFDKEFSQISAHQYIEQLLVNGLHAKNISIGFDHRFGRGKRGNQFLLKEYKDHFGYEVQVVPPFTKAGQIVSSSIIRKLLKYGDIQGANTLLGRDYMLRGSVVKGVQRGRELGYPTANIKPHGNVLIPACGVYAVNIQIGKDNYHKVKPGVLNIGYRPTFSDRTIPTIEAFIFDLNEDIYDKELCLFFKEKIRDERKFDSAEELVEQIKKDIQYAKQMLSIK
jgi:riboflavin kinase/FMN adenylyltransferase